MATQVPTAAARLGVRVRDWWLRTRSYPSWSWPGPITGGGITTQDSGWVSWGSPWNFWQTGHVPQHPQECAAVEAAVSAYAQTAAMLPGDHWRRLDNGGRERVTDSPLARVLFRPNSYQTRSDFILNQVRALYFRGNAYALATRDDRDRVTALHPLMPTQCQPWIDPVTKDVFYSIAPTELTEIDERFAFDASRIVPARYIWHVRLNTPRNPLIGETPLAAACMAIAATGAINAQQARFFENMSRPSGTLNTELILTAAQVKELRERWQEQSAGINVGGVPILTAGLKWLPLSLSATDAQLIDYYKLSIADIARAMRVPLALIGEKGDTFNNTEVLMQFWVASGLGFLLEHLELSLDQFFGLPAGEYSEFNTAALLRSNFKERIEGLVRGVQGGIYTPNEGRASEGLSRVAAGDEPRMQQQVVPLSWWDSQEPGTTTVLPPEPPGTADPESSKAIAQADLARVMAELRERG